jgi:hypothetical protein
LRANSALAGQKRLDVNLVSIRTLETNTHR